MTPLISKRSTSNFSHDPSPATNFFSAPMKAAKVIPEPKKTKVVPKKPAQKFGWLGEGAYFLVTFPCFGLLSSYPL